MERIVDLQIRGIAERLMDSDIQMHLTEPARNWLASKGYDPQFGARPLRRTIQRYVENPLSVRMLRGDFHSGDLIVIDELNGQLIFERHEDTATDYLDPVQEAEYNEYPEQHKTYEDNELPYENGDSFEPSAEYEKQ